MALTARLPPVEKGEIAVTSPPRVALLTSSARFPPRTLQTDRAIGTSIGMTTVTPPVNETQGDHSLSDTAAQSPGHQVHGTGVGGNAQKHTDAADG